MIGYKASKRNFGNTSILQHYDTEDFHIVYQKLLSSRYETYMVGISLLEKQAKNKEFSLCSDKLIIELLMENLQSDKYAYKEPLLKPYRWAICEENKYLDGILSDELFSTFLKILGSDVDDFPIVRSILRIYAKVFTIYPDFLISQINDKNSIVWLLPKNIDYYCEKSAQDVRSLEALTGCLRFLVSFFKNYEYVQEKYPNFLIEFCIPITVKCITCILHYNTPFVLYTLKYLYHITFDADTFLVYQFFTSINIFELFQLALPRGLEMFYLLSIVRNYCETDNAEMKQATKQIIELVTKIENFGESSICQFIHILFYIMGYSYDDFLLVLDSDSFIKIISNYYSLSFRNRKNIIIRSLNLICISGNVIQLLWNAFFEHTKINMFYEFVEFIKNDLAPKHNEMVVKAFSNIASYIGNNPEEVDKIHEAFSDTSEGDMENQLFEIIYNMFKGFLNTD